MLDLSELYQFVTYAEYGTLSAAAEVLHISQPTLTRTMHHVEESFGVELFHRSKNRIELTETGQFAVSQAKALLEQAEKNVQSVQSFERSLHTITIHSCAPAPLWSLLPTLSHKFPGNTISSTLINIEDIVKHVVNKDADIGILPYTYSDQDLICVPYIQEQLFVCVPPGHALEEKSSLTFDQINGFNCILKDHIGFWADMVKQKMPSSRFLVQTEDFAFEELVRSSTLLSFVTNITNPSQQISGGRKCIPLTDQEANVSYHFICRPEKQDLLKDIAVSV